MKRAATIFALVTLPLLLLAVAWQAGRFDALAERARSLEASQETWVQENRKIEASIRVLSSRERIAAAAEGLGLDKAGADRRLRVVVQPAASAAASASGKASQ